MSLKKLSRTSPTYNNHVFEIISNLIEKNKDIICSTGFMTFIKKLGEGTYGIVNKMSFDYNGMKYYVALKTGYLDLNEITALKYLRDSISNKINESFQIYYGNWTCGKNEFIVTSLIHGKDLASFSKNVNKKWWVKLFTVMIEPLYFLDSINLRHNDLNTNNILVAKHKNKMRAFIIDFGFAKRIQCAPGTNFKDFLKYTIEELEYNKIVQLLNIDANLDSPTKARIFIKKIMN